MDNPSFTLLFKILHLMGSSTSPTLLSCSIWILCAQSCELCCLEIFLGPKCCNPFRSNQVPFLCTYSKPLLVCHFHNGSLNFWLSACGVLRHIRHAIAFSGTKRDYHADLVVIGHFFPLWDFFSGWGGGLTCNGVMWSLSSLTRDWNPDAAVSLSPIHKTIRECPFFPLFWGSRGYPVFLQSCPRFCFAIMTSVWEYSKLLPQILCQVSFWT